MKMELRRRAVDKIYKRRDKIEMPDFQREEVWPEPPACTQTAYSRGSKQVVGRVFRNAQELEMKQQGERLLPTAIGRHSVGNWWTQQ